jgi:hypothetical protein
MEEEYRRNNIEVEWNLRIIIVSILSLLLCGFISLFIPKYFVGLMSLCSVCFSPLFSNGTTYWLYPIDGFLLE